MTLHHLRQQLDRSKNDKPDYCLSDFIAPKETGLTDWLGGFAVTAGIGIDEHVARFEADHDDYSAIMLKALADRLEERLGRRPDLGAIDITLYRDDLYTGLEKPSFGSTDLPFGLDGCSVVLVDDVLFTGRSLGVPRCSACSWRLTSPPPFSQSTKVISPGPKAKAR